MRRAIAGLVAGAVLALSACGSADGSSLLDPGSRVTPPASAGRTEPTPAVSEPSANPVTPSATSGTVAPPLDGQAYSDPQGKYTLTISPKWIPTKNTALKAEIWNVGAANGGVPPGISVYTDEFSGAAAGGVTLKMYMQVSVKSLKKIGYTIVRYRMVNGVNSARLGAIEYTGGPQGKHSLVVIDVSDDAAAVVTLSSAPRYFSTVRARVLPFMLTINAQ